MVYKKYSKKGGKTFGPYYYESYRHDGKVKKIYIGGEKAYKQWLKNKNARKKAYKKAKNNVVIKSFVEQPSFKINKDFVGKVFFLLFLVGLVFIIGINVGNIINFSSYSFTGFAISENISEVDTGGSLYAEYEDEKIVEQFDANEVVLQIKEPPKFGGEAITKNKNKRMDFKLKKGDLRLYFDLMNYTRFVEVAEEVIIDEEVRQEIEDEEQAEKEKKEKEKKAKQGGGGGSGSGSGVSQVPGDKDKDKNKTKEDKDKNKTKEEKDKNKTKEEPEEPPTEEPEEPVEEPEEPEEPVDDEDKDKDKDKDKKDKSGPDVTGDVVSEEPEEPEEPEPSITGNIIKNIVGLTAKVIGFDVLEDEVEQRKKDKKPKTLKEASEETQNLKKKDLEVISEVSAVDVDNLDIKVQKSEEMYKWGYDVEVNDLNFMAKIDVTTNENISIYDSSSLRIGDKLLSFADLVEQGYIVRIEKPGLEMNISNNLIEEDNVIEEDKTAEEDNGIYEDITIDEDPTITGNIIKGISGITGFAVDEGIGGIESINTFGNMDTDVEDLKYENIITVYIERDFTNIFDMNENPLEYEDVDGSGDVSIGDIIYLDPSFVTIEDVSVGASLTNITAETDFTHLSISNAPPYDSLILYLPFDMDGNSDYTVNNNNADVYGSPTLESGKYGNAIHMDGTNDYVNISNVISGLTDFTISMWVKLDVSLGSDDQAVFGEWAHANRPIIWYADEDDTNTWRIILYDENDAAAVANYVGTVETGKWEHLVLVYSADNKLWFYENNVEVAGGGSGVSTAGMVGLRSGPNRMGLGYEFSKNKWNGRIDEFMIFNTSLNVEEVGHIYNNQSKRFKNPGLQGFGDQGLFNISTGDSQVRVEGDYQANLGSSINLSVGYYTDSWASTVAQVYDGDNLFDISTSATNITLNFTFYPGNFGGSSDYYTPILSSDVNALTANIISNATPDITPPTIIIDSPVNTSNFNASRVVFNASTNEEVDWCGLSISGVANQTMILNLSSTGAGYTNSSISDGSYSFIFTCNDSAGNFGTSSNYSFLVDTVFPGVSYDSSADADSSGKSSSDIFVNISTSDANKVSSFIDFDNGLVAWWRMDDVDGSGNPLDYVGSYDGTAVDGASQVDAGYLGKGFEFDGDGDYVDVGTTGSLSISGERTISAWIKGTYGASSLHIIEALYGDNSNRDHYISVYLGEFRGLISDSSGDNKVANSIQTLNDGEWYHVAMTWDGTSAGGVVLYVNGVNDTDTVTNSAFTSSRTSAEDTTIGVRDTDSPNSAFNGTIDDLMIFNRSLSDVEIRGLYANKSSEYLQVNYTSLADGAHTFKAYTQDQGGNVNSTAQRTVTIESGTDVSFCRTLGTANTVYTLTGDLSTEGDCLVIGADNITIDMAGYNMNNTDPSNGDYGIDNIADYDNLTVENGKIYNFHVGIYSDAGMQNNFTNLTISAKVSIDSVAVRGIYVTTQGSNSISNINISNMNNSGSGGDVYGIHFVNVAATQYNTISNTIIDNLYANDESIGIFFGFNSDDNIVRDTTITNVNGGGIVADVQVITVAIWHPENNTFINVSYTTEIVAGSGELIRKWYYRAYSNVSSNGTALESVNITATNSSGDVQFSVLTGGDGYTAQQEIIDYVNVGGTVYPYSNYTINATRINYDDLSKTYNLTINENNLEHVFSMDDIDTTPPVATFAYPINTTYANYVTALNYTHSGASSCWYSINEGVFNYTYVSAGTNWTRLNGNSSLGSNTWTIYCNDSVGNENSTSVTFIVDNVFPSISYDSTTDVDWLNKSADNVFVNVSASDATGNISTFIDFDGSLVAWWRMDDTNGSGDVVDYLGLNNGTAGDGASQTDAGYLGKGFEFDGVDDYINLEPTTYIKNGEPFTISTWIYSQTDSTDALRVIVNLHTQSGSDISLVLRGDQASNAIALYREGGGTDDKYHTSSVNYADIDNQWIHVVATNDGTHTTDMTGSIIYLNGVAVAGTTITSAWTTGSQYLGWSGYVGGDLFNGTLDDVMIFNRSLSAEEIRGLYANKSSEYLQVTYDSLVDGAHTFKAYTQDQGGNVNNSLETRTVTIDTTYPTWASNETNLTSSTAVGEGVYFNITLTEANPDSYIFSWYDGTNWENTTSSYTNGEEIEILKTINSDTGTINWTWYINDTANNLNQTDVWSITLTASDSTPPSISIAYPVNATNSSDTGLDVKYTFSDDNIDSCWWTNNTGVTNFSLASCGTNITSAVWPEGKTTVFVYANDTANNVNVSQVSFTIDTTYPQILIVYPVNSTNSSDTGLDVKYTFSDDNIDSCWWTNNTGVTNFSLASCGTNLTGKQWPEGSNTIFIYANDTVNNVNVSQVTFTIDITYPLISIVYPANSTNSSDTGLDVKYTFSDDNIDSCWWTNNTGVTNFSLASCGTNITSALWPEGTSTVFVYANDTANNVNVSQVSFTIDSAYPQILIVYPVNGSIYSTNITELNYTLSDDNLAGCWYSTDSGVINSSYDSGCSNITDLSGTDDKNTWTVYINDSAGNENKTDVTFYSTYVSDCGTLSRVNEIYTLQNDLSTIGSCLVIGANNITVDMNGYNMTGDSDPSIEYGVNSGNYDNLTVKDGGIYGFNTGVELSSSEDVNLTNLVISAEGSLGTFPSGVSFRGKRNYIDNLSIGPINNAAGLAIGIYIQGVSSNIVKNTKIENIIGSADGFGIWFRGGDTVDHSLIDISITNVKTYDIFLDSTLGHPTLNITALNVSYDISKEEVDAGSELIRKWYYRAYVNDTDGNGMASADVKIYNNTEDLIFSLTTNASGWTGIGNMIDYVNVGGTRTYYSNYTIIATNSSGFGASEIYNVTSIESNLNHFMTLESNTGFALGCGTLSSANTVYTQKKNIIDDDLSGDCIIISAQNITYNGNGYYISGSGDYTGVYSNQLNTTVKNCNISMGSGSGGRGIELVTGADNSYIYNNTLNRQGYGLFVVGTFPVGFVENLLIENNTFSFNSDGVYLDVVSNSNLTGSIINSNKDYGIYFYHSEYNSISDFAMWNNSDSANQAAFFMHECYNQTIENGYINKTVGAGIRIRTEGNPSYGHVFKNMWINNTGAEDIYITTLDPGSSAINNTFLNVSFNSSDVSMEDLGGGGPMELTRKWYYRAYVNNSISGNSLAGINITAHNSSNNYVLNLTTNASGWTGIGHIIDYVDDGTINYYSNYIIYAGNDSYPIRSFSYNVTENENNLKHVLSLDNVYPQISIAYPVNGSIYSTNITELNYTSSDDNLDGCWYSTDSGVTNSSYDSGCSNITDLSGTDDKNTWTVYVNDSVGNENSSSVTFYSTYISDCGTLSRVNEIYTLQNDLSTTGTCLVIGANNITIDMNGYNMTGDNNSNADYGISNTGDYGNLSVKDGGIYGFGVGVLLDAGEDANLTSLVISTEGNFGGTIAGVYSLDGDRNYMDNLSIGPINNTGGTAYGIYILDGDEHVLENSKIENIDSSGSGYGIYAGRSSNGHNVTNVNIANVKTYDIYFQAGGGDGPNDVILLNVSYDVSKEELEGDSDLTRKWYYRVYVNDTDGNDVASADVEAYNNTNDLVFSLTTNASGWTPIYNIIDHVTVGGTRTYYSNYTIIASNSSIGMGQTILNITQNTLDHTITLNNNIIVCGELSVPNVKYIQTADITDNGLSGACIIITAQNITLDCAGYDISSEDDYTGVYSNQYNTTIKNCNISMGPGIGGIGIEAEGCTDCPFYILNNTLSNQRDGIELFNVYDSYSLIDGNTVTSNVNEGIYIDSDSHYINITNNILNSNGEGLQSSSLFALIINNTANNNDDYGVHLMGDGNNLTNITANNNGVDGIYISASDHNLINIVANKNTGAGIRISSDNNNLINITANNNSDYGIYINSDNNNLINIIANNNSDYGIYMGNADNNNLNNSNISGNGIEDIGLFSSSTNNVLLNVSYDISKEDVTAGSSLIRKWYYQSNVTEYYSGIGISGANVSVSNSSGDLQFSILTDSNGLSKTPIIDYVNTGGTRTYYSPYTLTAANNTYFNRSVTWNVTAQQNNYHSYYMVKSQSNITLHSGWNLISLDMDTTESSTDRNISVVEGWNLIGYSSDETNLSLGSATFHDGTSSYTWAQTLSNNLANGFLSYLDTNAQDNLTKFKYLSSISGADDTAFRNKKGYWMYVNSSVGGNLTLPGVGGSTSDQTYAWNKLRFRNSSGSEMNITDSWDEGWINPQLQYWADGNWKFVHVGLGPFGANGDAIVFNSYQGYFVKSNVDNITLIRQN